MALVSIAKAAKLTGKSRQTLYTLIRQGKLSKTVDSKGNSKIDTSELLRVFGSLNSVKLDSQATVKIGHYLTANSDNLTTDFDTKKDTKIALLEQEVKHLKELMAEKDKRLLLLENKVPEPPQKRKKFLGIF